MNTTKRILSLCIGLLLCFGIFGCTKNEQTQVDTSLDLASNNSDGPGSPTTPKQVPNTPVEEYSIPDVKLDSSLIYQPGETITDGDLSFSNFKCSSGAQLPSDIQSDKFIYRDGDLTPGSNALSGGKEYLFAEFEISNNSQTTISCNIGSYTFIIANSELIELGRTYEPRYFSAGGDVTKKDFYNLALKPNEKRTIVLGYILDKEALGNNALYYTVGEGSGSGIAVGDSSVPFVSAAKCFTANL